MSLVNRWVFSKEAEWSRKKGDPPPQPPKPNAPPPPRYLVILDVSFSTRTVHCTLLAQPNLDACWSCSCSFQSLVDGYPPDESSFSVDQFWRTFTLLFAEKSEKRMMVHGDQADKMYIEFARVSNSPRGGYEYFLVSLPPDKQYANWTRGKFLTYHGGGPNNDGGLGDAVAVRARAIQALSMQHQVATNCIFRTLYDNGTLLPWADTSSTSSRHESSNAMVKQLNKFALKEGKEEGKDTSQATMGHGGGNKRARR